MAATWWLMISLLISDFLLGSGSAFSEAQEVYYEMNPIKSLRPPSMPSPVKQFWWDGMSDGVEMGSR
jgi:hypothetical protein